MKQVIIICILIAILFMMYRIYTISNEGWQEVTNTIQTKYIELDITIPSATQPGLKETIKTDISKFLAQVVPLQTNLVYYPNVSYITNIHTKSIEEANRTLPNHINTLLPNRFIERVTFTLDNKLTNTNNYAEGEGCQGSLDKTTKCDDDSTVKLKKFDTNGTKRHSLFILIHELVHAKFQRKYNSDWQAARQNDRQVNIEKNNNNNYIYTTSKYANDNSTVEDMPEVFALWYMWSLCHSSGNGNLDDKTYIENITNKFSDFKTEVMDKYGLPNFHESSDKNKNKLHSRWELCDKIALELGLYKTVNGKKYVNFLPLTTTDKPASTPPPTTSTITAAAVDKSGCAKDAAGDYFGYEIYEKRRLQNQKSASVTFPRLVDSPTLGGITKGVATAATTVQECAKQCDKDFSATHVAARNCLSFSFRPPPKAGKPGCILGVTGTVVDQDDGETESTTQSLEDWNHYVRNTELCDQTPENAATTTENAATTTEKGGPMYGRSASYKSLVKPGEPCTISHGKKTLKGYEFITEQACPNGQTERGEEGRFRSNTVNNAFIPSGCLERLVDSDGACDGPCVPTEYYFNTHVSGKQLPFAYAQVCKRTPTTTPTIATTTPTTTAKPKTPTTTPTIATTTPTTTPTTPTTTAKPTTTPTLPHTFCKHFFTHCNTSLKSENTFNNLDECVEYMRTKLDEDKKKNRIDVSDKTGDTFSCRYKELLNFVNVVSTPGGPRKESDKYKKMQDTRCPWASKSGGDRCRDCNDGEYRFKSGKRIGACRNKATTCGAGKFFQKGDDTDKDRDDTSCVDCEEGTYKTGTSSATACTNKTTKICGAGKFFNDGDVTVSDRDDTACNDCADGTYKSGTSTAKSCSFKNVHTTCLGRQLFTKGDNTQKTRDDTKCETLTVLSEQSTNKIVITDVKNHITSLYRNNDMVSTKLILEPRSNNIFFYTAEILFDLILEPTTYGSLSSSNINKEIAKNNKNLLWVEKLLDIVTNGPLTNTYRQQMKILVETKKIEIKQHIANLLKKLKVTDPTPQPPSTTLSPAPAACKKRHTSIIKANEVLIRIKKMDNCNINDKQLLEEVTKKYLLDLLSENDLYKIKLLISPNSNITKEELLKMIKIDLDFYMGSIEIIAKFDNLNIKRFLDKGIINANLNKDKMGENIYNILQNIISLKQIKKNLQTDIINTIWENAYDLFPNPYQNVIHDNNSNKIKDPHNSPNSYNDEFEPNLLLNTYKCNNDFVFPSCSKDSETTLGGTILEGTSGTTLGGTTVEGTSGTTLGGTTVEGTSGTTLGGTTVEGTSGTTLGGTTLGGTTLGGTTLGGTTLGGTTMGTT